MPNNDLPKIWNEDLVYDPETGEIIDNTPAQDLIPIEESKPLPTIAEQKKAVADSDISEESKGMLDSLIEMNGIAQVLEITRNTEMAEQRRNVIGAWCENFIGARLRNNVAAEKLKAALIDRLLVNVNELDLETSSRILNDLQQTMSVDSQQAMAMINGGSAGGFNSGQGNLNLVINNATSEGASITNQTLNTTPQQVGQLKEITQMNTAIKGWNNIALPRKKTPDTEF